MFIYERQLLLDEMIFACNKKNSDEMFIITDFHMQFRETN